MRLNLLRLAIALGIGIALEAAATLLQPRFVVGSIPDWVCELLLIPGKLLAVPFHDRGNASPEFLWRSRVFGSVILSAIALLVFPGRMATRREVSE
jgi:hypothetical protein